MHTDNFIYRLPATQIVPFWEAIKFACVQADEVKMEDRADYFNELLQALLSDKAQVFVVLDSKRILHTIAVTRIIFNKVNLKKELLIQCLYSMTPMDNAAAIKYFSFAAEFARKEGCTRIVYNSRNPRIWELAALNGCQEQYRSFSLNVGGA